MRVALDAHEVIAHLLGPSGAIPNHPKWPLLVYPGAVEISGPDPAVAFERLFDANRWPAAWRNGVYPYHHFHTTAHEALGVYSGEVTVQFGGEDGVSVTARPGDVIVLPAGVGHKKIASRGSLGIVGAYPAGQHADMNVAKLARAAQSAETADAVARVPMPERDPVFGEKGPLFAHWRA
jgi:uncharacterized protein YjlB